MLGFEALIDDQWVEVDAVLNGNKIVVQNAANATRIRYLYARYNGHKSEYPFVYNEFGLPVTTFDLPVEKLSWFVTVSVGNGTVDVSSGMVEDGGSFEATITPPNGKVISSVKVNGESVIFVGNTIKVENIHCSIEIVVEYKDELENINGINVKVNVENGEYELDKEVYQIGDTAIITLKPNSGFELYSISINGVYIDDENLPDILSNGLKIENILGEVEVKVVFSKTQNNNILTEAKKGCAGSVVVSILGVVALAGATLFIAKRKRDE